MRRNVVSLRWDCWYQHHAGLMLAGCWEVQGNSWHRPRTQALAQLLPHEFMGTAHFLLTSWPFLMASLTIPKKDRSCGQHITTWTLNAIPKNHLGLGGYCNSTKQVALSGLGLVKQVFRGILTIRNHDVGDLLLKPNNHNLPITHAGTCFFTLWINHQGPVFLWDFISPIFSSELKTVIAVLVRGVARGISN